MTNVISYLLACCHAKLRYASCALQCKSLISSGGLAAMNFKELPLSSTNPKLEAPIEIFSESYILLVSNLPFFNVASAFACFHAHSWSRVSKKTTWTMWFYEDIRLRWVTKHLLLLLLLRWLTKLWNMSSRCENVNLQLLFSEEPFAGALGGVAVVRVV